MNRRRIAAAIALGTLVAFVVAGCGAAQRGSEGKLRLDWPDPVYEVAGAITEATTPADKPNFFSTRGTKIVDAAGREARITGVNWFGMETGVFAPHGLWSRNWEEMLDQVASLGFNTIRLPYSSQLLDPDSVTGEGVDFKLNPDLEGLNGLQVMDKIVAGAGKRGLKVILDHHRSDVESQSKLWYTEQYPEDRWIADWVMLARRYRGNDTVIGADLHNEPAGDATWGSGDLKTDWRLAAERAGSSILAVNPDWLIIVEGIEKTDNDKDWYWMGGNLADARKHPVRLNTPNKLVYSAHDYGPEVYMQGWFKEASFPANLPAIWDAHWGYLAREGIAPVLLGEFGGRSVGDDPAGTWQRTLVLYLKDRGIGYTYWTLNPNSGDTGGILDEDWKTVHQDKMALLAGYQAPKKRVANPSRVDTLAAPKYAASPRQGTSPIPPGRAAPAPKPNDPKLQLIYQPGKTEGTTNSPGMRLKLINLGPIPLRLADLELRYWFNPNNEAGRTQILDVDWASIGKTAVGGKIVEAGPRLDYLSLGFTDRDQILPPDSSMEMVLRIHKDDWSDYNQEDDYSFSADPDPEGWKRVTAYVGDKLTWGVEPKLP